MTIDQHNAYATAEKKFWALYTVIVVCVLLFLVFVIAQDNQEKMFYSLMGAAVAYVFRPSRKFVASWVQRLFGVAKPEERPEEQPEDRPEDKSINQSENTDTNTDKITDKNAE